MKKCRNYRTGNDTRKTMTTKQIYAVSTYLLEKYKTVDAVIEAAFAA